MACSCGSFGPNSFETSPTGPGGETSPATLCQLPSPTGATSSSVLPQHLAVHVKGRREASAKPTAGAATAGGAGQLSTGPGVRALQTPGSPGRVPAAAATMTSFAEEMGP